MNKRKLSLTSKFILSVLTIILIMLIAVTYYSPAGTAITRTLANYTVVPLQNGLNRLGGWMFGAHQEQKNLDEARAQIDQLESEIAALKEDKLKYETDLKELEEMRSLMEMKKTYSQYDTVGASVIASSGSNWFYKFTIDKGSNDGLELNMNVLSGGGLVGYLSSVGPDSSVVTAIINDSTSVSPMSSDTKDICVISGDLNLIQENRLRLTMADRDSEMKEDSLIVTSQISDKYLSGIPVGYVTEISTDADKLSKSGYITPVVDFEHLGHVLIIKAVKKTE